MKFSKPVFIRLNGFQIFIQWESCITTQRNIDKKKKDMARIKNSPLEGLSGTLGDLVFRTWNGRTYVSLKSDEPQKESEAQRKNRDRFRLASMQAKDALTDTAMLAHYQREAIRLKLPNAYTAALQDMIQ